MKQLLYISDLTEATPLFHSQVIPHVNELKKSFDVNLVVLRRAPGTDFADKPYFNYRSIKGDQFYYLARLMFVKQAHKIRSLVKSSQFNLIYSRGIRGGLVGSFIKKYLYSNDVVLLNDTRGNSLDGMKSNFLNRTLINYSNKIIYRHSDLIFLVSNYLKERVCDDYKFNTNNAFVFPTFVADHKFDFKEGNRRCIRKALGFTDNDVIILYSGSLEKYQNLETIFSALKKSLNPHLKMLVLTREKEITALVRKYELGEDKVKVKSIGYEQIEKYYHAADFGILIRDNDETNKSAAPTKFSEYVNAGLGLIINSIEADYIRVFKEKKLKGYLLEEKEDLLKCFNTISPSLLQRNNLKINNLSELVQRQKEILNRYLI